MPRKSKIKVGDVFGDLTVIGSVTGLNRNEYPYRYSCGTEKNVRTTSLTKGWTTHCGHLREGFTNGLHKSPEYNSWLNAKYR